MRRRSICVVGILVSALILSASDATGWKEAQAATSGDMPKIKFRGTIGSGGLGGVIYVMAAGFANLADKYVPGLSLTVESTSGSVELAKRVGAGDLQFATCSNDTVYYAHRGGREFKEKYEGNRSMLGGNAGQVHMYVLTNSPVKSWADLRGKRIALTSQASLNFTYFSTVWEALGFKRGDYKPEWIQSGQYADALKDAHVDAALLVAGYPVSTVTEVATTKGVRLLPIPENVIDKLLKQHPYWFKASIPRGTYKGTDVDVLTLGNTSILIANKDVPSDVVYALTKVILEHPAEVSALHPAGKEWTKEYALRGIDVVAMHPGAEKYFKEVGLIKK